MPSAAAERKMAPIFVGFTTFSSTAIRRFPLQISSTEGIGFRFMAQRSPRVSAKPVRFVRREAAAV